MTIITVAIETESHCVVPREPTQKMIQAAIDAPFSGHPETGGPLIPDMYVAMLAAAPAAPPIAEKSADETAWLLERGQSYATVKDGLLDWTAPADHGSALRLSRRADAEMLATIMDDADRIAQHMWIGDAPKPGPIAATGTGDGGLLPENGNG